MIIDEAAYVEHHGVKGMKWGVRNSRRELRKVQKTAGDIRKQFEKSRSDSERKAAASRYENEVLKKIRSREFKDQYRAANVMTKGEKAVHVLMLGPLAALTIPATKKAYSDRALLGPGMEEAAARRIIKEMRS